LAEQQYWECAQAINVDPLLSSFYVPAVSDKGRVKPSQLLFQVPLQSIDIANTLCR